MSATPPTPSHPHSRALVRALAIVLICVSAALFLSIDSVYQVLQRVLAEAEPLIAAHPFLGAVVFVLLSAVSAMLAFFSSALLVPAAVFAWGNTLAVGLLWLGWLLGGMFTYSLGRGLRRSPDEESGPPSRFVALLPKVSAEIGFPLVLLWQLALPSELPGYLCGYLRVPFRTYVAALAVAELPYAIGAVLLGDSVVNRKLGWLVALSVVGATLGFLLVRTLQRRLDRN